MTTTFPAWLGDLQIETPLDDGALSFVPLSTNRKSHLDYLTLDDAAEMRAAVVCEISEAGSVQQMKVVNLARSPLFIADGTTLKGCKQNRVINISVLVPAASTLIIPVNCVESGRWRSESHASAPSDFCDSVLRGKMCDQTLDSLVSDNAFHVNQADVWGHVHAKLKSLGAHSTTAAYHALYEAVPGAVAPREIPYPRRANGIAVLYKGRICSLDLFDKSATLEKLWPRIVRGARVAGGLDHLDTDRTDDLKGFLANALSKPQGEFAPIGMGTQCRYRSDCSVGSALIVGGELLHLSLFGKQAAAAPAVKQPTAGQPWVTQPTIAPIVPSPKWWKFWK